MKRLQADVGIIGAGLVGLTTALSLAKLGYRVIMLDKNRPVLGELNTIDPRAYAIRESSKQLWDKLGIWETITRKTPIEHMELFDGAATPALALHQDSQFPLGYIVENHLLMHACLEAVTRSKLIEVHWECDVEGIFPMADKVQVEFQDTLIDMGLLIAADGRASKTRDAMGISVKTHDYHQQAIVCLLELEHPHQSTAYQWFHQEGILAFLPMPQPNLVSIVFSAEQNLGARLAEVGEVEFEEALDRYSLAVLGKCRLYSDRMSFPLNKISAQSYVKDRVVLVGDAAHVIHPLAGQGVNLGLSDVIALTDAFEASRKAGESIPGRRYLRRFERERKFENQFMGELMTGIDKVFKVGAEPIVKARRLGMAGVNKFPWLNRRLKRLASGLHSV